MWPIIVPTPDLLVQTRIFNFTHKFQVIKSKPDSQESIWASSPRMTVPWRLPQALLTTGAEALRAVGLLICLTGEMSPDFQMLAEAVINSSVAAERRFSLQTNI